MSEINNRKSDNGNWPSNEPFGIEVKYLAADQLVIPTNHPRKHAPRQVKQISRSISTFGFVIPIIVDEADVVLIGVGRLLAARDLGYRTVATIQVAHLSPAQKTAFVIADNRLTEIAKWDDPVLAQQLKELSVAKLDFDIEVTGFEPAEIDLRIESINLDVEEADAADDLGAASKGVSAANVGDLWIVGRHRLFCGSALASTSYTELMPGERADMVFTDPPYNVRINGHATGLGAHRHREFAMASGEMNTVQFQEFLQRSLELLVEHSKDGSIHYVCMDWRHAGELLAAGHSAYTEHKNICVWAKTNAGMGSLYRSQHELIFVFKSGTGVHHNNVQLGRFGRQRTNLWNYPGANSLGRGTEEGNLLALHPTVKPVKLVADAILDCSKRDDLILDPFLGSGTTLLAAERVGRRCYGLEIEPGYVDVIIRRWQSQTGDHAIHASSGCSFNQMEAESREASPELSQTSPR